MSGTRTRADQRYDRTLRVVMWSDAFLSVAMVGVGLVASPVVALLGVPSTIRFSVAVAAIACAVLLAAFGAITAVVIMLRLRGGVHQLPPRLWLPLPPGMRPAMYVREGRRRP
ncbi:MAG TPA: hypothetical protein VGN18_05885 [Jatrophihabitans sp.]|jgi:hypothetical protein|uniref:hypothetical protein n=1 Tax=Jatrophihabitans sp. TaxID=1932789 RepID=UPI002E0554FB|nr:hypothetical protein [Jatrophihabitans sp.]